jgi:chromosome partitioning protein
LTRITTIINQKGGVGKTTTAHALATGLLKMGYKPLTVDTDPQGNISYTMRADTTGKGIYEAMKGQPAADLIQHTPQGDILPSNPAIVSADLEFTQTGREYLLRDALEPIRGQYSHIIIDSPPALGILGINAMTASTDVIIPLGADIYSLQGLGQLYDTISKVKKYCNPGLTAAGLLLTRYSPRTVLARDITAAIDKLAAQLDTNVYAATIREGIAIKEAQTQRTSLFDSHPNAKPTQDYMAFIKEYLMQEGKKHE